jgi:signal transduction histidine kinase
VGLLLLAACLAGASYIGRIQRNFADILAKNVRSLEAAQQLELAVRQLRFHGLMYLMDPAATRLERISEDQQSFQAAFEAAQGAVGGPDDSATLQSIRERYDQYQSEQAHLRSEVSPGKPATNLPSVADSHPVRAITDACVRLLTINKDRMLKTADDAHRAARQGNWAMLALGIVGPISGLVMGYGVARGLRKSIYRLSVRVQDMAHHLDQDVATVNVVADGDFHSLDNQMQQIVGQIEQVASRLQRQQGKLARAEQLSAVGQLAAGVAHEIRNPLTGVKMLVEAAQRPQNPRPLNEEDLRVISRELGRVERTVQGLLDYSRLPAISRTNCDLRDVVGEALSVVRARLDQQHVEVRVCGSDSPVEAAIDRDQFHTVLINLLQNAADAMPQGGQLEIRIEQSGAVTTVSISDTGSGIAPELAEKLFTPFNSNKPGGTGLGLSLANRIIEEHVGTLTATNRPQGGACFTITLEDCAPETAA